MENINDPRNTGIIGLRGLKKLEATNNEVQKTKLETNKPIRIVDQDYWKAKRLQEEVSTPDIQYIGGQQGLGESSYDKDIVSSSQLYDISDSRGQLQSGIAQFGAGLAKMVGLAGTTFINNTVGLVAGIGSLIEGKEFWDNEINRAMDTINQGMEEALPNYYTNNEKESPWYARLGTANFWADGVIKNAGYVMGSIYSGGVLGKGISAALQGVAKATAKGVQAMNAASKVAETSTKAARVGRNIMKEVYGGINKGVIQYGAPTKFLLNSVAMSTGEASMEALRASNDMVGTSTSFIEEDYTKSIDSLNNEMLKEYNRLSNISGDYVLSQGEDGKVTKIKKENALHILVEKHQTDTEALNIEKESRLTEAKRLGIATGNATFGSNLLILALSNAAQFQRMLNGGYLKASAHKALRVVNKETGEALRETADITRELLKGTAKVEARKGAGLLTAGKIARNFLAEGSEEGLQNVVSNTAQLKYSADLNTFAGAKLNPYVGSEVDGFLNAGIQVLNEQFGSVDSPGWEEFVVGGIMGIAGVPTLTSKANATGKSKLGVEWQGGIPEAKKEAKEAFLSNTVVEKMNQRLADPRFVSLYQGAVRRGTYQQQMDKAVEEDNEFNYSTSEAKQLLSDALMFEGAGLASPFLEMANGFGTITKEGIEELKNESVNEEGHSIYDGKTDEEIIQEAADRASTFKKEVKQAMQMHQFHKGTLGKMFKEDALEELTYLNYMATHQGERANKYTKEFTDKLVPALKAVGIETLPIFKGKEGNNTASKEINISTLAEISPQLLLYAFNSSEPININGKETTLKEYLNNNIDKNFNTEEIKEVKKALQTLKDSRKASKEEEIDKLKEQLELLNSKEAALNNININEKNKINELAVNAAQAFLSASAFNIQYTEALSNPELLTGKLDAAEATAIEETRVKMTQEEIDAINKTTSIKELREVSKTIPEERKLDVLRNLNPETTPPEVIANAKELVELFRLRTGLEDIIDSKLDTQKYSITPIKAARTEIEEVTENSQTVEEALSILHNSNNNALQEVLSIYEERLGIKEAVNNNNPATLIEEEPKASDIPTGEELKGYIEVGTLEDNGTVQISEESGVVQTSEPTEAVIKDPKTEVLEQSEDLNKKDNTIQKLNPNTIMSNTAEAAFSQKKTDTKEARKGIAEGVYIPLPEVDSKYLESYQRLIDFGAFKYMNSGKLGDKMKAAKKNKTQVPVYFLRDKAFVKGNPEFRNELLYLVVEDPEGTIEANNKRYQVVGDLKTTQLYAKTQNDKNPLAMDILNRVLEAATNSSDEMFISEEISLVLQDITSGRLALEAKTVPTTKNGMRTISKDDFPSTPAIGYVQGRAFHVNGLESGSYSEPNRSKSGEIEGSTYAMVKDPKGNYIPLSIYPKKYNDNEFPYNPNTETPLDKKIRDILIKILNEKFEGANEIESKYGDELLKWLHFGRSSEGYFIKPILFKNADDSIELVLKGRDSKTGSLTKDANVANMILSDASVTAPTLEELFQLIRNLSPRIQIDSKALKNSDRKAYTEVLLDSGAFYTPLAFMHTVNSSPILGENIFKELPTTRPKPVPRTGIEEALPVKEEVYTIKDDINNISGDIKVITYSNGQKSFIHNNEIVTDKETQRLLNAKIEILNKTPTNVLVGKTKTLYQIDAAFGSELYYGALVGNKTGEITVIDMKQYNDMYAQYKKALNTKKLENLPENKITEEGKLIDPEAESALNYRKSVPTSPEKMKEAEKLNDSLGVTGVKKPSNNLESSEKFPIFADNGAISNRLDKKLIVLLLGQKGIKVKNRFSNDSIGDAVLTALMAKGVVSSIEEFNSRFTSRESLEQVINCKL